MSEIRGSFDARGRRFAVAAGHFNEMVVSKLVEGALACFRAHGIPDDEVLGGEVLDPEFLDGMGRGDGRDDHGERARIDPREGVTARHRPSGFESTANHCSPPDRMLGSRAFVAAPRGGAG